MKRWIALICLTLLTACASAAPRTEVGKYLPEGQSYVLIAPKGNGDWAALDIEGDPYEIVPPKDTPYTIRRGVSATEALGAMREPQRGRDIEVKRIEDTAGRIVGYELRRPDEHVVYPNLLSIRYEFGGEGGFQIKLLPLRDSK